MSSHISPSDPVFAGAPPMLAHTRTPAIGSGPAAQAANGILYGSLLQQSSLSRVY